MEDELAARGGGVDVLLRKPMLRARRSLRSGHATTAAENGAPDRVIMRQTGHRSVETMEGYIGSDNVLSATAGRRLL